ncbi:MAG: hypothetical protein AB3N28_07410 [Kordiimonas sp.]
MTAIRNLVFVLLCSLTASGIFAGVASASQYSAVNWISDLTSEWHCEANGEMVSLIVADDFHAELLSANSYSLETEVSPSLRESNDNPFILVAETLWQSLWSTDDVILEVMSETAIKLIVASSTSNDAESQSLTCTIDPEVDA